MCTRESVGGVGGQGNSTVSAARAVCAQDRKVKWGEALRSTRKWERVSSGRPLIAGPRTRADRMAAAHFFPVPRPFPHRKRVASVVPEANSRAPSILLPLHIFGRRSVLPMDTPRPPVLSAMVTQTSQAAPASHLSVGTFTGGLEPACSGSSDSISHTGAGGPAPAQVPGPSNPELVWYDRQRSPGLSRAIALGCGQVEISTV